MRPCFLWCFDMCGRTLDEVTTIINHAKLDESELKTVSQLLTFSDKQESSDNYKLIELDSYLLKELLEGHKLHFRGDKDENAVLCTADKTFDVKEAETSNSVLLLPGLTWSKDAGVGDHRILEEKQVLGLYYKYYELRPAKPKLMKLQQLLQKFPYKGPEFENVESSQLHTFYNLLDIVQASENELKYALIERQAVCIKGFWRILDHDYQFRVVTFILNHIEHNSWPLDQVNKQDTLDSLKEVVPLEILDQCFDWYAEPTNILNDQGVQLYTLIESEVCRFLAEVLLRPAGKFNLNDFMSTWQQCVPEGMKTDIKYLAGIALMDKDSKPPVIWHFPETKLPEDISERFKVLFQTQEKWTLQEIYPYIERLSSEKMNVNAILTKYARVSTINGVKYYNARHAK